MSSTELIGIKDGKASDVLGEYRNSHLAGSVIWDYIAKNYTRFERMPISYNEKDLREFWDCWKTADHMPEWAKIVLLSTYDKVYVKRENLGKLIDAFVKFDETFPNTHCGSYAKDLKVNIDKIDGCCWYLTSITDDPWSEWDEETEEYVPYDFSSGDDHWELFEAMDEVQNHESKS